MYFGSRVACQRAFLLADAPRREEDRGWTRRHLGMSMRLERMESYEDVTDRGGGSLSGVSDSEREYD